MLTHRCLHCGRYEHIWFCTSSCLLFHFLMGLEFRTCSIALMPQHVLVGRWVAHEVGFILWIVEGGAEKRENARRLAALIQPLHKKDDRMSCQNCRGISLLNVTYKILSIIVAFRLTLYTEELVIFYYFDKKTERILKVEKHKRKKKLEQVTDAG